MMDKVKVEAYRNFSENLLLENKRIFIIDFNSDFYFADILFVGEENIRIKCFAPEQRKDKCYTISWNKIIKLDEAKDGKQD